MYPTCPRQHLVGPGLIFAITLWNPLISNQWLGTVTKPFYHVSKKRGSERPSLHRRDFLDTEVPDLVDQGFGATFNLAKIGPGE